MKNKKNFTHDQVDLAQDNEDDAIGFLHQFPISKAANKENNQNHDRTCCLEIRKKNYNLKIARQGK